MLTISTALDKVLTGQGRSEHVRASVYDTTWRDLTSYPGFDAVDEVTWRGDIDSPFRTATVRLWRDVDALSLAPLMSGGAVSRRFNPATSPTALLSIGKRVRIDVAIVCADKSPAGGDWMTVFEGYIDSIDSAAGDHVVLECRDYAAMLQDKFIEEEAAVALVYYSGGVKIARIWQPSTAYSSGEFIVPTDGRRTISGSPRFYECTTGGTSGTSEPAWPTSSTVADNSATHTYRGTCTVDGTNMSISNVIQGMIDWAMPWGGSSTDPNGNALTTSGSPSWNLKPWLQDRESLYDAMRRLAEQLGWDLRYRYNGSEFVLTLYQPDRSASSPTRTFGASEYKTVNGLRVEGHGIRTAIQVVYSDASDLDPNGQPKRKVIKVTDSTSISAFGRKFMEIAESSASQIDTSTEATALANAALADLKDPKAMLEVELTQGFPYVEVGDYYRFSANSRHFSSAQDLAVAAFQCTAAEGRIRTTLTMRGQPAGAYWSWHKKDSQVARQKDRHSTVQLESIGPALVMNSVPGGVQMVIADEDPLKTSRALEYEFHVDSSSSGFTPSSSTLVAVSKTGEFTTTDLIPGKTYYGKVVPRVWNASKLVRGQPFGDSSNRTYASVAAGRNNTGHLVNTAEWGRVPLNGGFETHTDADAIADHWTAVSAYGSPNIIMSTSGGGWRGAKFLQTQAHTSVTTLDVHSAPFPVVALRHYQLHAAIKCDSVVGGATGPDLKIRWYDSADSYLSSTTLKTNIIPTTSWATNTFPYVFKAVSGAAYGRIQITQAPTATVQPVFWDEFRIERWFPFALARDSSGLSVADNTATRIQYDSVYHDPIACITTGASWVFTVPETGLWSFDACASLDWAAFSAVGTLELRLVHSASTGNCVLQRLDAYQASVPTVHGSRVWEMAAGDTVYFTLYHYGSSASKNMYNNDDFNYFSAVMVGDIPSG